MDKTDETLAMLIGMWISGLLGDCGFDSEPTTFESLNENQDLITDDCYDLDFNENEDG